MLKLRVFHEHHYLQWLFRPQSLDYLAQTHQIRFCESGTDYDAMWLDSRELWPLRYEAPTLVADLRDTVSISGPLRNYLNNSRVKAWLRQSVHVDYADYNARQLYLGEPYQQWSSVYEPHYKGDKQWPRPFLGEALHKVRLAFPTRPVFAGQPDCYEPDTLPELAERPLDVLFVGNLWREDSPVGVHRRQCWQAMDKLSGLVTLKHATQRPKGAHRHKAIPGKRLSLERYLQLLLTAKVVVSPWGWGAWCFRDYEALLSGCVVVKPRCDGQIRALDGLYDSGRLKLVWCRPDFSDLAAVVDFALGSWSCRRYAVEKLQKALDLHACLDHLSLEIKKALP